MDGYYDWVKEHIEEVTSQNSGGCMLLAGSSALVHTVHPEHHVQGAPLNESDHCGDPPLLLAAGNGASAGCRVPVDLAGIAQAPPQRRGRKKLIDASK